MSRGPITDLYRRKERLKQILGCGRVGVKVQNDNADLVGKSRTVVGATQLPKFLSTRGRIEGPPQLSIGTTTHPFNALPSCALLDYAAALARKFDQGWPAPD